MAANALTIEQCSTLLNALISQATGKSDIAAYNASDLVSVGKITLLQDTEKTLNAISQMMGKTLFSVRPYTAKFPRLRVTNEAYGNHMRKLSPIDGTFSDAESLKTSAGNAVDQYVVNPPSVVQLNWYGQQAVSDYITVYKHQLNTAFSSLAEVGQFWSMVMTNISDRHEQKNEETCRAIIANFIMGKIVGDTENVIHLLTEYNAKLGLTTETTPAAYTATTIYSPDVFPAFMKWVTSRISTISAMMTERTVKFHTNITDKAISRHTPATSQKLYMYAPAQFELDAMVRSSVYNDKYLSLADMEVVNFWQSINSPDTINCKPTYLAADGTLTTPAQATSQDKILGVLFDEEALGYTMVDTELAATPYNARGRYHNMYWHYINRYWNDFTENGVVFLLD